MTALAWQLTLNSCLSDTNPVEIWLKEWLAYRRAEDQQAWSETSWSLRLPLLQSSLSSKNLSNVHFIYSLTFREMSLLENSSSPRFKQKMSLFLKENAELHAYP